MKLLAWFLLIVVYVAAADCGGQDDCDKSTCKGPVKFYEDLMCQPIYKRDGDCCPTSYDCSNLEGRSSNRCYANGNEYKVGQKIREVDAFDPCDKQCVCYKPDNEVAKFSCPLYKCAVKTASDGCFIRPSLDSCCDTKESCPRNGEKRAKCKTDEGKTYLDGERYYPISKPNIICQCGKKGPDCRRTSCGIESKYPQQLRDNCAPIIDPEADELTKPCVSSFRCQNDDDKVISKGGKKNRGTCDYGNLKLRVGDELSRSTDPEFSCVECKCEVPPALTCRQLSDKRCAKKYPN